MERITLRTEDEMDVYDAIVNLNTVIVLLGSGLLVWIIRQIIPESVEKTRVWRVLLRVLPVLIGAGLALIPGLRPMENTAQSLVIGGVAGSLSSTTYEVVREALGNRIKSMMGSKAARRRSSMPPDPVEE